MTQTEAGIKGQQDADAGVRGSRFGSVLSGAVIFFILLGLIVIFTILEGTVFLSLGNFSNIAVEAVGLLLLAVGSTFVIITAGIDLSVGSVLVLSSVVTARVMAGLAASGSEPVAIAAGIVLGLLTGLICGLANGAIITRYKVPPFIVTLGMLGVALGAAQILAGGTNVPGVPLSFSNAFGPINELFGFLPVPVLIALVVVVIAGISLAYTRFGRYTYAIGSNAEAARRAGINVDAHLIKVYALSGLLAGLAGVLDIARFSTTSLGGHSADNLAAISAVVIGGTSLFGGTGTILGSVVGTFIPAVLRNGFVIQGVQAYWQEVVIGAILILAVYIDQRRRAAEERK
jgi:ribose transport system permease protein